MAKTLRRGIAVPALGCRRQPNCCTFIVRACSAPMRLLRSEHPKESSLSPFHFVQTFTPHS